MEDEDLIKAILWIVEGLVEKDTTERVFFGYDGDGELTPTGNVAAELIQLVLKIRKGVHRDDIISYSDEEQGS